MKSLTSIQAAAMRDAGVRPMAKSLHTVSVLVNVSTYLMQSNLAAAPEGAINLACALLNLDEMPDPHGLMEQALKQVRRQFVKDNAHTLA